VQARAGDFGGAGGGVGVGVEVGVVGGAGAGSGCAVLGGVSWELGGGEVGLRGDERGRWSCRLLGRGFRRCLARRRPGVRLLASWISIL
jgi:hypothetical protein